MSPPKLSLKMSPLKLKFKMQDHRSGNKSEDRVKKSGRKEPRNTETFDYGNYNRYYGYRNAGSMSDQRIEVLRSQEELFHDKDILDIGCNIGHITYLVARELRAKTVLGIDLDNNLIQIARKNVRYYNCLTSPVVTDLVRKCDITTTNQEKSDRSSTALKFPDNVSFLHSNYVLYHDDLLAKEEPRYDTILCLSVTKWIHLNWGDEGLVRTFKRMFLQLRSGGALVLEAQPFESYKKKKLPVKLRLNAEKVKLLPSTFENYLISEIGFESCETLTVPNQASKGFQRPVQIFRKK